MAERSPRSPRTLLLTTGGTIGFWPRPGRGAFAPGAELLAGVLAGSPAGSLAGPLAGRGAGQVVVEDVAAEPSWDVQPGTMLGLARRVRAAVADEGFDGVVVTLGTDTLEETAYLIDVVVGEAARGAGIVVTGAMRAPGELSPDGPRNLAAALTAAVHPAVRGAGVLACLNDELHAAAWVSKIDATNVAAFSSAPYPIVGRVAGGAVDLVAPPPPRPPAARGEPESNVALIKVYPGIDSVLLYAAADAGVRGLVLEGTGSANVPINLFAAIHDLITWDIPVVIASRCRTRAVPLAELGGGAEMVAKLGAIGARGLAPVKARAALMVALGSGGVDRARTWFSQL